MSGSKAASNPGRYNRAHVVRIDSRHRRENIRAAEIGRRSGVRVLYLYLSLGNLKIWLAGEAEHSTCDVRPSMKQTRSFAHTPKGDVRGAVY